jgi:outer membrane cobalamin receptor
MIRAICIWIILLFPTLGQCFQNFEKDTNDLQLLIVKGTLDQLQEDHSQLMYHRTAMDKLRLEDGIFVGQGNGKMLSSLRVNGSSAAQTALVWNDLKLNNSLNGQVDLVLLPAAVMRMDVVNLGSSFFGSNSMAGALLLNHATFDSSFLVDLNYGSFGNKNVNLNKSIETRMAKHRFSVSGHHSMNDYSYTSLRTSIDDKKLENAEARMFHFLYSNEIKLSNRLKLISNTWFLKSNRQLPPSALSVNDSARQLDESWRAQLRIQYAYLKWKVSLNNAISIDNLNYINPASDLNVNYKTIQHTSRIDADYKWNNLITVSGSYFYETQHSQIELLKQITNQGAFTKINLMRNGYLLSASSSLNQYSLGYTALNHNITANKKYKLWQFGFLYGTSFRPPTMNDLYWPVGGNEALLPEKGLRYQMTIKRFVYRSSKGFIKVEGVLNTMKFTDQIVWRPTVNPNIWAPSNINKTYHFNQKIKIIGEWAIGKVKNRINLNYNHLMVNSTGYLNTDLQLMLTPEHYAGAVLESAIEKNAFQLSGQFQGKSFINDANTAYIPAFLILNAKYFRSTQNQKLKCYIGLNNLTNRSYEMVYRRPLPRINYTLGITLKI